MQDKILVTVKASGWGAKLIVEKAMLHPDLQSTVDLKVSFCQYENQWKKEGLIEIQKIVFPFICGFNPEPICLSSQPSRTQGSVQHRLH